MVHEAQFHEQNSFLTLTYEDSHLPVDSSLQYAHVSAFIKRLRRRLSFPISYYRVGEYGENFSRPHYHLIVFGYDFSEPIKYHGVINSKVRSGQKDDRIYYKSSFATDCWSHGFADVGDVDFSTALYVSKYVTKKLYGRGIYGSRVPERSSSSKLRPIGKSWIEKFYEDVYPHDYVVYGGKKLCPPRYYDTWLSINKPSLWSLVKQRREDTMKDMYLDYRDLHAKHVIRVQRQSQFLRDGCAPNLSLDHEIIRRNFESQLLGDFYDS